MKVDQSNFSWAIIGNGSISETFVEDLKYANDTHEVIAVTGHSWDSTNQFADKYKIPNRFDSTAKMLEQVKPDCVYIATPHPMHFEDAKACLKAGIPVLGEKPLTLNKEQHLELKEISETRSVFLMEAMWIRFLPSFQQLVKWLREERIGKLDGIKAGVGFNAPEDPDNRYYSPHLGGGSLLDLGIYPLYLSQLVLGMPKKLSAIGTLSEKGIDSNCSMILEYENGASAQLWSSIRAGRNTDAEIIGDKGRILIADPWFEKSGAITLELSDQEPETVETKWQGHGLYFEVNHMIECLRAGETQSKLHSLDDSLQLIQTLDAIREQLHVEYSQYE